MKGSNTKDIIEAVNQFFTRLIQKNHVIGISPSILNELKHPASLWIQNAQSMIASQTLSIKKNNFWYHSRRDPYREARRILQQAVFLNKSHIIFLGAGLGYLIEEALKSKRFSSLLLIEPDVEILFYVLSRIATSENVQNSTFSIFIPSQKKNEDFDSLFPYLRGKSALELHIHAHSASLQAFPTTYLPLKVSLVRLIEKRMINQATLIKFQKIWNKNILLNVKEINAGGYLKNLMKTNIEKTIILAGAGPSLSHHTDELHKYRDKFLLFAVDTAYIPLLKVGIIPDVVFSSDPQWINHHYVLDSRVSESIWVLDPTVCPAIPHWLSYNKATMFWWDNPFYLDEFLREKSRGIVSHGGSVSTNAFDVACRVGSDNIILVGQDLSFTDSKAHAKGSVLEEMIFIQVNRFQTMELHNYKQLTALPPIKVYSTNKKEQYTFTNAKLMVYIEWFEAQATKYQQINTKPRLMHADPRGVLLSGFDKISLELFFKKNKEHQGSLAKAEHTLYINQQKNKAPDHTLNKHTRAKIDQLYDQIASLEEIYDENIRLIQRYTKTRQNKDMKKIEENDQKILTHKEANKIVSVSAQNIILEITENNSPKGPLHTSLMLYSTMQKVTKTFLYLLSKHRNR